MSYQAVEWAIRKAPIPKGKHLAGRVLVDLAERADEYGHNAYPTLLTLGYDLGAPRRSIVRALDDLMEAGLIAKDGIGPNDAIRYRLLLDHVRTDTLEAHSMVERGADAARAARYRASRSSRRDADPWENPLEEATSRSSGPNVTVMSSERHGQDDPHNHPLNHQGNHPEKNSRVASLLAPAPQEDAHVHTRGIEHTDTAPSSKPALPEEKTAGTGGLADAAASVPAAGELVSLEQPGNWNGEELSASDLAKAAYDAVGLALANTELAAQTGRIGWDIADSVKQQAWARESRSAIWGHAVRRFGVLTAAEIGATA